MLIRPSMVKCPKSIAKYNIFLLFLRLSFVESRRNFVLASGVDFNCRAI